MKSKINFIALIILGIVVLRSPGCGDSSSQTYGPPPTPPPAGDLKSVSITGMVFSPESATITKGAIVIWTNNDAVSHSATSDDASWDTGIIAPGASDTLVFTTIGTFSYHCVVHPMMTGSLTVK